MQSAQGRQRSQGASNSDKEKELEAALQSQSFLAVGKKVLASHPKKEMLSLHGEQPPGLLSAADLCTAGWKRCLWRLQPHTQETVTVSATLWKLQPNILKIVVVSP